MGEITERCESQEAGILEGHLGGCLPQEVGDRVSGGRGTRTQILVLGQTILLLEASGLDLQSGDDRGYHLVGLWWGVLMARSTCRAPNGAEYRVNPQKMGLRDIVGKGLGDMPIASKPDKHCLPPPWTSAPLIHSWGLQVMWKPFSRPRDAFVAEATH